MVVVGHQRLSVQPSGALAGGFRFAMGHTWVGNVPHVSVARYSRHDLVVPKDIRVTSPFPLARMVLMSISASIGDC